MSTFIVLGKYSIDGIKDVSPKRTKKAAAIIEANGGQLKAVYALLGKFDLLAITEFPGVKEAMKASIELTKNLNIAFTTMPAITVEEFDNLIEGT
jgi:uncharacterized protein with GYD domain